MAYYDTGGKYKTTDASQSQQAEQNMSQEDLASLRAAGDAYNTAKASGDQAAMDKAHSDAEAIRARYGYSGGNNGTEYNVTYKPTPSEAVAKPPTQQNPTVPAGAKQTYVMRADGTRVPAYILNGQTVDADGNPFQFQNGDYVSTQGGYYQWNNGAAAPINTNAQKEELLKLLGWSNGYTPSTSPEELAAGQAGEAYIRDNMDWGEYLDNGIAWNLANDWGNQAGKDAAHTAEEGIREQIGYNGGADGTGVNITNPSLVPEELLETFAPYIVEFNEAHPELAMTPDQFIGAMLAGYPVFNTPELADSPEAQLALSKIGDYPEFVQAVIASAPGSDLALQFEAMYPELAAMPAPLDPLQYDPKYMLEYWNRFNEEYSPDKFAGDWDDIRDQLLAANNAAIEKGRLELENQIANAEPGYDKLRQQNELAKAKAANNTAAYNAFNGDLGGIGSAQYSAEQNAYDQRMQEIRLEQQNFINETNQQIALLEAEGRLQEAQLLAEWGQARLAAMQDQYNQYWTMYQNAAANMENTMYGIASDDWNRRQQIREDQINDILRQYEADVNKYNADLDLAKLQFDVDAANRDFNLQKWLQESNLAMQLADMQNDYNAQARADERTGQKLQLDVDEANRNYDWQKWVTDTNLALQIANEEYNRGRQQWADALDAQQVAFSQAMQKLQLGALSAKDISALGISNEDAKNLANYFNLMRQIDMETAQAQLGNLLNKAVSVKSSGGGSGGGGGGLAGGYSYYDYAAAGYTPETLGKLLIDQGYSSAEAKMILEGYTSWYKSMTGGGGEMPTIETANSMNDIYEWLAENNVSPEDAADIWLPRMGVTGDLGIAKSVEYSDYLDRIHAAENAERLAGKIPFIDRQSDLFNTILINNMNGN